MLCVVSPPQHRQSKMYLKWDVRSFKHRRLLMTQSDTFLMWSDLHYLISFHVWYPSFSLCSNRANDTQMTSVMAEALKRFLRHRFKFKRKKLTQIECSSMAKIQIDGHSWELLYDSDSQNCLKLHDCVSFTSDDNRFVGKSTLKLPKKSNLTKWGSECIELDEKNFV